MAVMNVYHYIIRRSGEWGEFFVSVNASGGISVSVISTFGNFGYHWGHPGEGPWQDFLGRLDMSYAMGKFMGLSLQEVDYEESRKAAVQQVLEVRRSGEIDAETARDMYEAMYGIDADSPSDFNQQFYDVVKDWCGDDRHLRECFEPEIIRSINPQAQGFWRDLWPQFIEAIKREQGEAQGNQATA